MSIESETPSRNHLPPLDNSTKLFEEWRQTNLPPEVRAGTGEPQEVGTDYYSDELAVAERLQDDYPHFADLVSDENLASNGTLIGGGMSATVHRITLGGIDYAVRTLGANHSELKLPLVAASVLAPIRAHGVVGAEQLVTFSVADGKTISHFIEGTPGNRLTADVLGGVDDVRLEEALATLEQLQLAGVSIDGKRANFIIGNRISCVDLGAAERFPQTYAQKVDYLINVIANGGLDLHPQASEADFADLAHEESVRVALLERLQIITSRRYPDDRDIEQRLAAEISRVRQNQLNYADPDYVAKAIAADEARRAASRAADKATSEFAASGMRVITGPPDDYVN